MLLASGGGGETGVDHEDVTDRAIRGFGCQSSLMKSTLSEFLT
jgi:hypothetical protein